MENFMALENSDRSRRRQGSRDIKDYTKKGALKKRRETKKKIKLHN